MGQEVRTERSAFEPVGGTSLPIFRRDTGGYAAFYAPGCLCIIELPRAVQFEQSLRQPPPTLADSISGWSGELQRRAMLAVAAADAWREGTFRPECLTLYMNNECNMSCSYCHTDPSPRPATRLDLEAIDAAAKMTAAYCRQKDRPFYAVFHGGGEPSLHRQRVETAMALIERAAADQDVEVVRYVATNGLLPEEKANWLAHRFDLVGLSCDGPPDLHDAQRPRWDGRGSLSAVERTARILREEGCHLHARTTITRAGLRRQAEISTYICQQIAPEEIHFEPVYVGGRTDPTNALSTKEADDFVTHFLAARAVATGYGIRLLSSGSRPGELHGPHCHVFRDVINLVPGDVATACFKLTEATEIHNKGAAIGAVDQDSGRFEIDQGQIRALAEQLAAPPPQCAGCFNRYHCTRECPDTCLLDSSNPVWEPGFRCRVQAAITSAILQETADRLWSEVLGGKRQGAHGTTTF
jgi:uncharacterized protein